jgi:hypothetical protein
MFNKPRIVQFSDGSYGVRVSRFPDDFLDLETSDYTFSAKGRYMKWISSKSLEVVKKARIEYMYSKKKVTYKVIE